MKKWIKKLNLASNQYTLNKRWPKYLISIKNKRMYCLPYSRQQCQHVPCASSSVASFNETSTMLASVCQRVVMAAMLVFCSNKRLFQMGLELQEAMAGVVWRGERERGRMDATIARVGIYSRWMAGRGVLMVGGRWTGGWHRSSFPGSRACLM